MEARREEIRRYLLHLLYKDFSKNRYISYSSIATALELKESVVTFELDVLVDIGLVDTKESGVRLSQKGLTLIHQRVSSYCPHI